MNCSRAQIIATVGPASSSYEVMKQMASRGMDVVRLNFSWSDFAERSVQLEIVHQLRRAFKRDIPTIADLPGPRIQYSGEHTYDLTSVSALTEQDKVFIKFAIEKKMDYVAISFVGSAKDIEECKKFIKDNGGTQKVIAKIERLEALNCFDEILKASDAIMIARGDLGNEVALEKIPFIQAEIVKKTKLALKPVITATQMLTTMVGSPLPTRAEVTDVANAIIQGSDAVMLSEETSVGKYPVETIAIMERIVLEAERHMPENVCTNILTATKNG